MQKSVHPSAKSLNKPGPLFWGHFKAIRDALGVGPGDAVFFVCGKQKDAEKFAGLARTQDYFRCLPRKPAMSSQ
jgi:hypothetical protein